MPHFEQGFGTKIKFAGHIRRRLRMDFIEKIKNSRAATCSREQCDALPTQNNQNYRMVSTVFFFFFLLILYRFLRKLFFAFILFRD